MRASGYPQTHAQSSPPNSESYRYSLEWQSFKPNEASRSRFAAIAYAFTRFYEIQIDRHTH